MTEIIDQAETVIIGAGIVGSSIAYHLSEMGYFDALVVDAGSLDEPPGSTGHAPGLLGRLSPNKTLTAMADYTADLLGAVPQNNPALTRVGSVEVARDQGMLSILEHKLECAKEYGIEAEMITVKQLKELVPYMDTGSLIGGLWVPGDGALNARRALKTLQNVSETKGIRFRQNLKVIGFRKLRDGKTGIETSQGLIACDKVVVAVGIWGRELLESINVKLPLFPVQHPYVYTEPMEILSDSDHEAKRPLVRDLDHVLYLREHNNRFGYGWYNHRAATVDVGSLSKADIEFPEKGFLDAINYDLFPFLKEVPLSKRLNGIFSMTPDGAPLMGRVHENLNVWVAEAVWVTHSGGVGKSMAEMLLQGESSFDVSEFGPGRFNEKDYKSCRDESLRLYNDIYSWAKPGSEQ